MTGAIDISDRPARAARAPRPADPTGPARPVRTARPIRTARFAWVLLALPIVLYALRAARFGAWIVDDAFISFGYARTLDLAGVLAQTPNDDPVEAISNPTWTLLLAGLRWVGLFDRGHDWFGYADYVWVIRGLALACFAGTLACLYLAARSVASAVSAALAVVAAGSLLALSPPYVMWTISGLENPLYGLVVAGLFLVLVRSIARGTELSVRTAALCSLLVVAAAATRPDGLVFAAGYPLVALLLFRRRWAELFRVAAVYTAVFVVPVGLLLAWRRSTFGLWVPNTAVAKGQSGASATDLLARVAELPTMLTWPSAVAALLLVAAVLVARRGRRPALRPFVGAGALLGLAVLGFGVLRKDWMAEFRFGTPTIVLAVGCLALAAAMLMDDADLLGRHPVPRTLRRNAVATVLAAAVVATAVVSQPRVQHRTTALPISGCFVADRYGRLFNLYADRLDIPAGGSLLAPDIGGTIMTSRLRVVDLAGLADPAIARFRAENDAAAIRDYVLDDVRPTFIHIHGVWRTGLPGDPRFRKAYVGLGSAGDYVRRDAVGDDADLKALAREGRALSVRLDKQRRTRDCGALTPGQLPA